MRKPAENVVLLGMMGSGKTTVGRKLAEQLNLQFVDTDELVERAARRTIAEIFSQDGEARFRSLERRAIARAASGRRQVIATGGGAVLDAENLGRLQRAGLTIWLKVQPEAAATRVTGNGERPLLSGGQTVETLSRLLSAREPYYREALLHVDTSRHSADEVTASIIARLRPASTVVPVATTASRYDVAIGWGTVDQIGERLSARHLPSAVAVVTNPRVGALYADRVTKSLRSAGFRPFIVRVPDGERYKTLRTASRLYDELVRRRFERRDLVLALGGGVIGDLAGFVAATYLRGVDVVQVPTTVVAQVDSSIGGKTGVDHRAGKNLIGAFHHPVLVDSDVASLMTLPPREFVAGMAEVVKYGVIADVALFEFLESHVDAVLHGVPDVLVEIVCRSVAVKADVVGKDERETGLRRILNYGHTAGHVVETLTGYSRIRHGEGVAVGMHFAAGLAARLGVCDEGLVNRQRILLDRLGLPTRLPRIDADRVMGTMRLDKKVRDGRVHFVLPRGLGSVMVEPVAEKEILALWREEARTATSDGRRRARRPGTARRT